MTRISENQSARSLITAILSNRGQIDTVSEQITSGIKVKTPGDSLLSGQINRFQQSSDRIESYKDRTASVKALLANQDSILAEASNLLIRASEIAAQGSNGTNSPESRSQLAEEVFQIRDHMVSLANSTYQGRYIYGCAHDETPPYYADTYDEPTTGDASKRYVFNNGAGTDIEREVKISDDLSVTVNTKGSDIFDNAIQSLERLGRALKGFETLPSSGAPTGSGTALTFPADYERQTEAIQSALNDLRSARENDIMVERVNVGGRQRRIDTAESILGLSQSANMEALDRLQNTDMFQAATELTQAQTALEASMAVSARILNLSILDYL